ncbi:caspase family protein [Streptomyces sp. NPDC052676]|uniref:caspase family protein n=1 Tax=Streptomyces sp. NPDC052676 TaxID=3154953 RepID=UPI0034364E78
MPSPAGSRAVLIGVSRYDHLTDVPNVERNLGDLRRLLTSPRSWNLPEENCLVIPDPADDQQVLVAVQKAAEQATDALLVYYAGHGQIDSDEEEFFLTLPGSRPHTMWTGIEYRYLRREIQKSRARARMVILDCCYADRATMSGDDIDLAEKAAADGTCVLAAAAGKARFEEAERHTFFTGELLDILTHGVPGGPPLLDADSVFRVARDNLVRRGKPRPTMKTSNTAAAVPLACNTQYASPADVPRQPARKQPSSTPVEAEDTTVRFTRRHSCLAGLLLLSALLLVLAAGGLTVGDPLLVYKAFRGRIPAGDPREDVIAYSALSVLAVGWLGFRFLFAPYELRISAEGVQVRRRSDERWVARYSWHRVLEARVEWVPARRHGHGPFLLLLRLREGTPAQLPRAARRAGRRWGLDGSCVADLGRLACTPHEVDQALERFAPRDVWTRTQAAQRAGYTAPTPTGIRPATTLHGTTRRALLGVLTLVLTAVALIPAVIVPAAVPAHRYGWAFVPMALWTLFLVVPALLPALLLWHGGSLSIGPDGISHSSRRGTRHWTWDRIDRVGIVSWRRRTPASGVVFLRPRDLPSSRPAKGVDALLAPLEARFGGVLVCDLFSMGISREEFETVVLRYAGDLWDPHPRPHGIVRDDQDAAHYEGDFAGPRSWVAAIGAVTATSVLCGIAGNLVGAPHSTDPWLGGVMAYTLLLVGCLPFLVLRSRLTVRIDHRTFVLESRARRLTIPWDHVDATERLTSGSGKNTPDDDVVLWLRPEDASRYRGYWRLGAHLKGVELRIATLRSKGALDIPAEQVDAALRRFGPERFRSGAPAAGSAGLPPDQGSPAEDTPRRP